jgi:cell division septal protein FtsQ
MIRRGKTELERDSHYWRRRANRRVRKARATRHLGRAAVAFLAMLVLSVAMSRSGSRLWTRCRHSPRLAVSKIEVEGTVRASPESLRDRLSGLLGQNIIDLSLDRVAELVAHDPWVLSAAAKRIVPHTIRVTITERRPSALAIIGGVPHVIDSTGFVLGPSGPELSDDLPVLSGLDGLDETALVRALQRGAWVGERLGKWGEEISELDLSQSDRVIARTIDPGPEILLDPLRAERNVGRYLELREEISYVAGPVTSIDLRWRGRISVRPAEDVLAKEDG